MYNLPTYGKEASTREAETPDGEHRVIDNTNMDGGRSQDMLETKREYMDDTLQNIHCKCSREEREAGAQGERHRDGATQC